MFCTNLGANWFYLRKQFAMMDRRLPWGQQILPVLVMLIMAGLADCRNGKLCYVNEEINEQANDVLYLDSLQ